MPLIPRRTFFRDPDRANVRLSPDGAHLAWTEPVAGVQNVFVAPTHDLAAARPLTRETVRSIGDFGWTHTGRHMVLHRDRDGSENFSCHALDIETGAERALIDQPGVRAFVWRASRDHPTELLFGSNARDRRFFDVVRIDVTTGATSVAFENTSFAGLLIDDAFAIRLGSRVRPDGVSELMTIAPDGGLALFLELPLEDAFTTSAWRCSHDGASLFLRDSRGRDTAALIERDWRTGKSRVLAEDPEADIVDVWWQPGTARPLAAISLASRQRWHLIDPAVADDLDFLRAHAGDADFAIVSQDQEMRLLVIAITRSDAAADYHLYNRSGLTMTPLFKARSDLDGVPLRPMREITIPARDGLALPSYLTLPYDDFRAGPLVMVVHGGPYARDVWGYNPLHQWLANRGYAVLSVNFRGSTGFGKAFINAADHEWGGRMQDDLTDAAHWAVAQGYADPGRLGFFGGSYGGYAALMAATGTPETFACIVDIFGPSNLMTLMQAIPPYWQTWFVLWRYRLASPDTEEGRAWLIARSPITHVDRIVRPLLIAQGMNDVRVKPEESEQIVNAMTQRNIPVTYATFSDEGHGFVREQNRLAFSAVMEAFLARHLGGEVEPIGDAFDGSTIRFAVGVALIPGLRDGE